MILALDPLVQGVQGVGKVVPKPKPEVKKPQIVSEFDEMHIEHEISRKYHRCRKNPKKN